MSLFCLSGYPLNLRLRQRHLWTVPFVFVTIKGRLVLKRNISHSPFRSADFFDEWEKIDCILSKYVRRTYALSFYRSKMFCICSNFQGRPKVELYLVLLPNNFVPVKKLNLLIMEIIFWSGSQILGPVNGRGIRGHSITTWTR